LDNLVEIRWHGRGGQGAVTSAELVAQAAIAEGKYAQAFPSFGPERRGAPVMSFNRVSNNLPIRIRAGIVSPDIVVVLDPSLLSIGNVTSGLKEKGTIVINSQKTLQDLVNSYQGQWNLAAINATAIARDVIGVPIVNTTMIGALLKATALVKIQSMLEPLRVRFGKLADKNFEAMNRAYELTQVKEI
jgi:pyruvate ferredoxin oxidoreductase gamma subunit